MDVFVDHPLLLSALKDIFSNSDFWRMKSSSTQIEASSTLGMILNKLSRVYKDEIVAGIEIILAAFNDQQGFYGVKVEHCKKPQNVSQANRPTTQKQPQQIPKPNAAGIDDSPKRVSTQDHTKPQSDSNTGSWGYFMPFLTIIVYIALIYSHNRVPSNIPAGTNGSIKACVEQVHGYCLYP